MKVQPINTYNNRVSAVNKIQNYCTAQKPECAQLSFKSNATKTFARYLAGGIGVAVGGTLGMALEPAMAFIIGVTGWLVGYHGLEAYQEYQELKKQNNDNLNLNS